MLINNTNIKINFLNNCNLFYLPNTLYLYFLRNILLYYYLYKFNKIKYYGKTYRILYYKNFINFKVGKSHPVWVILKKKNFLTLKKKKNLIYIRSSSLQFWKELKIKINLIRKINKYTKRGVRINKYKFSKRYGKVSQAFMGLH